VLEPPIGIFLKEPKEPKEFMAKNIYYISI
jgi:hypothetical protein